MTDRSDTWLPRGSWVLKLLAVGVLISIGLVKDWVMTWVGLAVYTISVVVVVNLVPFGVRVLSRWARGL